MWFRVVFSNWLGTPQQAGQKGWCWDSELKFQRRANKIWLGSECSRYLIKRIPSPWMTAQLHSAFGSNKKGTVCSKGIYYPFGKASWQQPVDLFTYNTLFKLLFLGFHPIVIRALAQRPVVVLGPLQFSPGLEAEDPPSDTWSEDQQWPGAPSQCPIFTSSSCRHFSATRYPIATANFY